MLAIALVVMLGQCSKDTECKGDRICVDGQCVGDAPLKNQRSEAVAGAEGQARMLQLRGELAELREELADSGWVSPILKIVGGAAVGGVSAFFFNAWSQNIDCQNHNLSNCDTGTLVPVFAVVTGALALGWLIWGSIQFRIHSRNREQLPPQIEAREAELIFLQNR